MCGDTTCACDKTLESTTGAPVPDTVEIAGVTWATRHRLRVDERGRVYYGRVRLPFLFINGAFRFKVKEPHLRRQYGREIVVKLEYLAELLDLGEHRQV
jgi:hypothetical protein